LIVRRSDLIAVSKRYHHPVAMTVRTDDELERALTALAEAEGTSRQEIVRRAVLERYERSGHAARVQDSSARLIDRWGDVLNRLGTV
jgi:predicted transcriptional regulator